MPQNKKKHNAVYRKAFIIQRLIIKIFETFDYVFLSKIKKKVIVRVRIISRVKRDKDNQQNKDSLF